MPTDEKKTRPSAEVVRELNNLLARAGAIQFNMSKETSDLAKMNAEIDSLNIEWAVCKEAEAKAAEAAKSHVTEAPAASPEATQSV